MGITRVTDLVLLTLLEHQISKNKRRELELQEQLATGKKINRAQDNPIGASRMLQMEATLSTLDQYLKNVQHAQAFLDTTETALNGALDVLEEVRAVAATQGEPAVSEADRQAAAAVIEGYLGQLVQLGNTKFGNVYIFGGRETMSAPFDDAGTYSGDSGQVEISIGSGHTAVINVPGSVAFKGEGGGEDLFDILADLKSALINNSTSDIRAAAARLETAYQQVNCEISKVGLGVKQLEIAESSISDMQYNVQCLQSATSDADPAEVATQFQVQANTSEATLLAATRMLGVSLVDLLV